MISKYSVKKPYTVVVAVVLVIILGIVSFTHLTVDLLPNMNLPYVMVMTTYPGASPESVETTVTKPIEQSMATVSNIKNITSTSQENASSVILEFEQTTNMDSTTIEIRESLDQISGYWPDSVANPIIMKLNPNMMPIMITAISADSKDASASSDVINSDIIPDIESLEGVASVSTIGSIEKSISVTISEDKINATNQRIQDAINGKFSDAQSELDSAKSKINSGKNQLKSGESQLSDQSAKLAEAKQQLEAGQKELDQKYDEALAAAYEAVESSDAMQQMRAAIDAAKNMAGPDPATIQKLNEEYDSALKQAKAAAKVQVDAGFEQPKAQLAEAKAQLDKGLIAMDSASISATIQMATASASLAQAETQMKDGQTQLDEAKETALEAADLKKTISVESVNQMLTAQNFSMPAGYVKEEGIDYLVRVGDKFKTIEDIQAVPLFDMDVEGLEPIKLSDVADVTYVSNEDEVYAKINGQPGVMVSIQKQTGYSTGDVCKSLNEEYKKLQKDNKDLKISTLMDQGVYIDLIVNSVLQNIVYGAILAIIILLIFLRSVRPTFIIACSIPISIVAALVLMYFSNITLNVISLSGLALGVGMLVDNSIVVIENIYRMRNEEGASAKEAAIEGARQVSGAIAASTLTTICVFAPIVFTQGITRQLFVDMGLTIAYSLIASLVVALTVVPMMAAGILKKTTHTDTRLFTKIKDIYGKFLYKALHLKVLVFILAIVLLGGSAVLAYRNGTAFMPEMTSTQISMTLTTKEGSTMKETGAVADQVMKKLEKVKDIEEVGGMVSTDMYTGQASTTNQVELYALVNEETKQSSEQLQKAIEKATKDIDGELEVSMSNMDMSALGSSGIVIEVKGKDLDKLQSISGELAELVKNVKGTADISDGMEDTTTELRVMVDKDKAVKQGLMVAQVYQEIQTKLADAASTSTLETDTADYDMYVKDQSNTSLTRDAVKNLELNVTKQDGSTATVKLSDVATFEDATGLQSISHDGQTRTMRVTAGIADGANIGLVSADVKEGLKSYDVPAGYEVHMAGEDETIMESMVELMKMLGLAVVFMYLIMVAQFQSLRSPFIILFTIPLAFTGGLLGLWMTGSEISVIAMVGFVMLSGIIVNNGIVFVDYTNQLVNNGMDKKDALVEAGKTRLRPIIMTALTTILGLSTMAIGVGMGADMVQPMAIVTIGGLIYGTLLTLVVVPCIYDLFHNKEKHRLKAGIDDEEEV